MIRLTLTYDDLLVMRFRCAHMIRIALTYDDLLVMRFMCTHDQNNFDL